MNRFPKGAILIAANKAIAWYREEEKNYRERGIANLQKPYKMFGFFGPRVVRTREDAERKFFIDCYSDPCGNPEVMYNRRIVILENIAATAKHTSSPDVILSEDDVSILSTFLK